MQSCFKDALALAAVTAPVTPTATPIANSTSNRPTPVSLLAATEVQNVTVNAGAVEALTASATPERTTCTVNLKPCFGSPGFAYISEDHLQGFC